MKFFDMEHPKFSPLKLVIGTIVMASIVAGVLFALKIKDISFYHYFIFSQSIGLSQVVSIILFFYLFHYLFKDKRHLPVMIFILLFSGLIVGSIVGVQIGAVITGKAVIISLMETKLIIDIIIFNLVLGIFITAGFVIKARFFIKLETRQERVNQIANSMFTLKGFAITLVFNTLIAIFLHFVGLKGKPFGSIFLMSQCIGFSVFLSVNAWFYLFRTLHPFVPAIGGVLTGSVLGPLIGARLLGKINLVVNREFDAFFQAIVIGLIFGAIGSCFFYFRAKYSDTKAQAEKERAKRIESKKEAVETNLKLLQAQIEPHFLFNTLSNILSLLDTDLDKGKSMLIDLTKYLRTSLTKTRSEQTTLEQEMEMIRAYLSIFKIRMGDRLTFKIDLPEELKSVYFPPMLIQPLVENSIKHGIEPKVEGGEIVISVQQKAAILRLIVKDTGQGILNQTQDGVGLQNIRKRLSSIFGEEANLSLIENSPSGLKAIIEVPYEQ
jgi:sensor histidine kinase YesM